MASFFVCMDISHIGAWIKVAISKAHAVWQRRHTLIPVAKFAGGQLKGRLHTPKTTAKMPTRDGARARRGAIDAAERAQAAALADEGCWNAPSQCQSHDDGHGDGSGESVPESTGESKEHVKLEDDGCGTMRQSAEKLENDVCGSKQAAGAGEDESHLSEYEKLRQANIKRNNALLESLDIPSNPIPGATVERQSTGRKNAKKRKPLLALAEFQEPRRSGRRLALADQQREEPLLALPDSWDEAEERPAAAAKRKASIQEIEDRDWDLLEPPPSMHDALEQIGLAQADAVRCLAVSDWKQFAIDKWGPLVARAKVSDWQVYVTRSVPLLDKCSPGIAWLPPRWTGWQQQLTLCHMFPPSLPPPVEVQPMLRFTRRLGVRHAAGALLRRRVAAAGVVPAHDPRVLGRHQGQGPRRLLRHIPYPLLV